MLTDLFAALTLLVFLGSLAAWPLVKVDPLLQIAQGALWLRCGAVVAARMIAGNVRDFARDTKQLMRHQRRDLGV